MTLENRHRAVQAELAVSADSLAAAGLLREQGFHRESISRAYYAAFYLARSLLISADVQVRTHLGVNQPLNLLFIRPGRLEARYSRLLSLLQSEREGADYQTEVLFTQEDSRRWLEEVEAFQAAVREILCEDGYLKG